MELLPGDELGPYLIEALVGVGGPSRVYRSIHVPTGERVAIKIGRRGDDELYRRLQREASVLAAVDHPHIVGLRNAGVHSAHPFVVTDWVEGPSLAEVLADEGRLSVSAALDIARVVAGSLDHLHRLGVVHCDLSATNVLLEGGARPMLIDLGAGPVGRSLRSTVDATMAATYRHVAPEVTSGDSVDGRADQYSLAAMVHELVTGGSPFPPTGGAGMGVHDRRGTPPEPLSTVDPTIGAPLEDAVLRGLATDPDDRFDSCADLVLSATGRVPASTPAHDGVERGRRGGGDGRASGLRRGLRRLLHPGANR